MVAENVNRHRPEGNYREPLLGRAQQAQEDYIAGEPRVPIDPANRAIYIQMPDIRVAAPPVETGRKFTRWDLYLVSEATVLFAMIGTALITSDKPEYKYFGCVILTAPFVAFTIDVIDTCLKASSIRNREGGERR